MALTKHQLRHINRVIIDSKEEGNDKALKDAEKILKDDSFPIEFSESTLTKLEDSPSFIHDFLEKNEEGIKWLIQP